MKRFLIIMVSLFWASVACADNYEIHDQGVLIPDDYSLIFGTDLNFYLSYDETTDNRLELSDGTNTFLTVTDDGTTATFAITGDLNVSGAFAPASISTGAISSTSLDASATVDAGTMTIGSGSITDSSGAISFGNENLSTTGTLGAGATTVTSIDSSGQVDAGTITIDSGSVSDSSGSISFDNENLSTTGTLASGAITESSNAVPNATDNLSFFAPTASAQLRGVLSDEVGTGAAYFVGGALGTPAGGTLTNATGLPISSGVSGLGANVASFLATPSSANLRSALTDESGTGADLFQNGDIGEATGTSLDLSGVLTTGSTTVAATGPTDNLDVSGANVVKIDTGDNNVTIGGFTGGVADQVLYVVIVDATNDAIIENAESTGNQDIYLESAEDETKSSTYGGWILVCDGSNWYQTGGAGLWTQTGSNIYYNDGSVGIGTMSPYTTLEIVDTSAGSIYDGLQLRNNATDTGTGSRLRFINSTDSSSVSNSVSIASIRTGNDNEMAFETENAEAMRIDESGNVGIGLEDPNQKLTIEGTMSLKEQASANADTAGYGQPWVKTATPNEFYFTDDAGTDTQISSHPLDAPQELYQNGPGLDWIGKRVQPYLGVIFWQTLDGTITEETFDAYNLRRKDEPGHVDLVKQDWNTVQLAKLREAKLAETVEIEIAAQDAFGPVEITEDVQVEPKADGFKYAVDKGWKVSVTVKMTPVTIKQGTGKFKKQLKADISFDPDTGKFIQKRNRTEAEVDAMNLQAPEMPGWMKTWVESKTAVPK